VQVVDMPDDDVRSVDVLIAQVRRQPQPLPCVHGLHPVQALFDPRPHRAMQFSSPYPLSRVSSCQIPVDGVTPAEAESPEFQEAIVEAIVEHLDGAVDEDDVQVHPYLGPI